MNKHGFGRMRGRLGGPGGGAGRAARLVKFFCTPRSTYLWTLSGQTVDSAGAALAGCTVRLFDHTDALVATLVSDGSGNFTFNPPHNGQFYWLEAVNAAGTLVATTLRNLVAV